MVISSLGKPIKERPMQSHFTLLLAWCNRPTGVAVAIALGDDSGVIGEIAVAVFVFIFLNTGSYYIAQAGLKL